MVERLRALAASARWVTARPIRFGGCVVSVADAMIQALKAACGTAPAWRFKVVMRPSGESGTCRAPESGRSLEPASLHHIPKSPAQVAFGRNAADRSGLPKAKMVALAGTLPGEWRTKSMHGYSVATASSPELGEVRATGSTESCRDLVSDQFCHPKTLMSSALLSADQGALMG